MADKQEAVQEERDNHNFSQASRVPPDEEAGDSIKISKIKKCELTIIIASKCCRCRNSSISQPKPTGTVTFHWQCQNVISLLFGSAEVYRKEQILPFYTVCPNHH